MKEKIPIPEQRKPHPGFWEGFRTKVLLRQVSNLAGYNFTQEGSATDLRGEKNVAVSFSRNAKEIRISQSHGKELQETTVAVVWDEIYGNHMLPYVHARRRTLVDGQPVGEDAVYDSSFEPSKNTLSLGSVRGELHEAITLTRQREANPLMLQVPTSTLDL